MHVFGARWKHMKLAHLVNTEGAGLRDLPVVEPPVAVREEGFDYWNSGISHLALTVDDLERGRSRALLNWAAGPARSMFHELPSGSRVC